MQGGTSAAVNQEEARQLLETIQAQRAEAVAAIKGTGARKCSVCGKEEGGDVKLKVCSACKHPDDIYCGTDCQAAAWKGGHKDACKRKKAEAKVELSTYHAPR
eukprot:Tamp_29068.p2 GENE.Tamp_29068~~Tamp_29068.p2  ORF type:complete len:103 (-),score=27.60 Tamp_29068:479-787(-)